MSAILLDDKVVHYEVLGRGRPVIFLHGWVGSWRYWVPAMQTASISYRTYALDQWGFGDTTHDPTQYSLERQSTLLNLFLQEMGIGKVALIGHGLGALSAILFESKYPDLVDRLMLINVPLEIKSVSPRLRTSSSSTDLADWLLGKFPVTEPARVDAPRADLQAITRSLDDLGSMNYWTFIEKMTLACLFVHGKNDPAIEIPDYDRILLKNKMAHRIILEESSHFPMLEEGQRFNELLMDFLTLAPGASPGDVKLKKNWKRRVR